MIINHNLAGANAISKMNANSATASKSMQKLSSGLRINSASDDAAGLAISEKMRGQIRGLDQASANSQDGISMIQTAEGALSETHSILQRMRELAVQSSNDTNVAVDRGEIQKEMDQLTKEVSRISNNTEFNTQKLINGGISDTGIKSATFHVGANAGQNITLSINAMDAKSLGITRDVSEASIDTNNNAAKIATVSSDSVDVTQTLADGKYKVELTSADAGATTATDSTGNSIANLVSGTATADTNITLTYTDHGTAATKTAASAINATTNNMTTTSSLKINGVTVDLTNTKLITAGTEADVVTALQKDIDSSALGSGKYTVSVGTDHKLTIASTATGAATKVDLTGSDVTSATALGFTNTASATGAATGGTKDWVATGSLGGVVSASNNTVNGITIDQTKLSTTAALGETVTIKGFKDATLTAQLQSVTGTGAPTTTFAGGAGETTADATVTGTATADTDVTLTYKAAVVAAPATIAAAQAGALAADTIEFASGANSDSFNGIKIEFSGAGQNGAPTATWDSVNNKVIISLDDTTTANNTAANIQSAIQGLTTQTKADGTSVDLSTVTATSGGAFDTTTTKAIGSTFVSAAFANGTAGSAAGWTASGDLTGAISGATNAINGLNIDMTNITGTTDGETVKISAKVASDIGDAVTIDQKNGGSYVIGDANGAGQMKVGFTAGTATAGTSTVNITTDVAKASTKQADGTMSDATVEGGLDVSTQSKASAAITTIQTAIEKVSAERSKLGAYSNRLEHTIANLGTSSENLTSAESRIRDVDMAKEMSTFSKNNILAQAAQAMLAQANQQPQQVLQLLR